MTSTDLGQSLSQITQPICVGWPKTVAIKSATIVLNRQRDRVRCKSHPQPDFRRPGMLDDVVQRFLDR